MCFVSFFLVQTIMCVRVNKMHLLNHTCQRYVRRSERNNSRNTMHKIHLLFTSAIESFAAFFFVFKSLQIWNRGWRTNNNNPSATRVFHRAGKNKYCSCGEICLRNWRARAHTSGCLVTNDCKKNKRNCAEGDFFSAPSLACSGVIPPPSDRQGTDCQDTPAHFLTLLLLLHIPPPHELFRFLKILPPCPRGGKEKRRRRLKLNANAKEKRNSLWACSWVWNSHV